MDARTSYTNVLRLIVELRQAATENQAQAKQWDNDGFGLNLGSDLANDAADTFEAILAERPANDDRVTLPTPVEQQTPATAGPRKPLL